MRTLVVALYLAAVADAAAQEEQIDWNPKGELLQVGVLVEFIELDARMANRLARKHAPSMSAALLREELGALAEAGKAKLVESCYTRSRSGTRTAVETGEQIIYPTEFDPPEIPETATLSKAIAPATAANPTAFDYRPIGPRLEVEPMIGEGSKSVSINVVPQIVRFLGRDYHIEDRDGLDKNDPRALSSTIYMPKFYSIQCSTQVNVPDGDWVLLSINRPHGDGDKLVMVLLRADILK